MTKPAYWITKNGKHIPIFDPDPNRADQISEAEREAYALNHPDQKIASKKEPEARVEPFTRMQAHLAAMGLTSEEQIAEYFRKLSPGRRSQIAAEMGITSKGEDRIKEMAHGVFNAGKETASKKDPLKKDTKPAEHVKKAETPDFKQQYESVLGPKKKVDPVTQLQKCADENAINPHCGKGDKRYHNNCALCTFAVAMQARGYDVEAMPRDTGKNGWRGCETVFDYDLSNPDNFIVASNKGARFETSDRIRRRTRHYSWTDQEWQDSENYTRMPKGADKAAVVIAEKVKSWGSGAVAEMSVQWKGKSRTHSVALVNYNGTVAIWDAQSNKSYVGVDAIKTFLKGTTVNNTEVVRIDNAPFKNAPGIEQILGKMVTPRTTQKSLAAQMNKGLQGVDWDKF